jgi:hypothetical protein
VAIKGLINYRLERAFKENTIRLSLSHGTMTIRVKEDMIAPRRARMLWHQGKSKIKRSKRSYLAPTSLSIDNFFILFLCDISTHLVRALFRLFVIFVGIRGGSSPFSPLPLRLVLPCLLPLRHVSSSFFSFFFATEKLHCRSTSTNQPRSAWSLSSGRVPTPASAPFTVLRWISN